jgi:putative NIF3 family GTP cyclohydrolase 1 type 2
MPTTPADAAPPLEALADFLDALLAVDPRGDDPAGIVVPTGRPVRRLGMLIEPSADVGAWAAANALDAVFLHRPWGLDADALPPGVGVLAYHRGFDARMSVGWSPRLAAALGMRDVRPLGEKDGAPLGMIGDVDAQAWEAFRERVEAEIGGSESILAPLRTEIRRVAVVGAMTDALVREAAEAGADAYLTGQMRVPARKAVEETGIGVVATGHARAEAWGLRALAAALRERFPTMDIVLRD